MDDDVTYDVTGVLRDPTGRRALGVMMDNIQVFGGVSARQALGRMPRIEAERLAREAAAEAELEMREYGADPAALNAFEYDTLFSGRIGEYGAERVMPAFDHSPSDGQGGPGGGRMRGMLIPTFGYPTEVEMPLEGGQPTLETLQDLVGGDIEPFDVLWGGRVTLFVDEDGIGSKPVNRAVYATPEMVSEGYVTPCGPVREGECYTILFGDILAVGYDPEAGGMRDMTDEELAEVRGYFSEVSGPGSGALEAMRIRAAGDPTER